MTPSAETIKTYKALAKESPDSMEVKIRANLEANCPKFNGNEDKFERCIDYLNSCAAEILGHRNGDVPDDVCYRICRDYFDDEIWRKEDEEDAARAAEAEARNAKKARKTAAKPVKQAAEERPVTAPDAAEVEAPGPEPETPAEPEEPAEKPAETAQLDLFGGI